MEHEWHTSLAGYQGWRGSQCHQESLKQTSLKLFRGIRIKKCAIKRCLLIQKKHYAHNLYMYTSARVHTEKVLELQLGTFQLGKEIILFTFTDQINSTQVMLLTHQNPSTLNDTM